MASLQKWPDRWEPIRELRPMGTAQVYECRGRTGEPALLLFSNEADKLARVRDAHARVHTPHVARVIESAIDDGYLAFACDAITDLEAMIGAAVDAGVQAPYPVGIAFNEMMMDTVEAAHAAEGGPLCLGELAWSNVLIGPAGHCWVFGFGYNFALRSQAGTLRHVSGLCQAPDVLLGMRPSPASDVYVLHASLRRLLPYLQVLDILIGAVGGARPELRVLRAALVALDNDAQATDPVARPQSVAALRARYREIRKIAGEMPDPDDAAMRAFFGALAQRTLDPDSSSRLLVNVDTRCVKVPGLGDVDLSRHRVLWRILLRLLEERRALPGRAVELGALREAAWPGERMLPEAARARVYVAISSLRKLGLRDVIVKRDDGYLVSPEVDV